MTNPADTRYLPVDPDFLDLIDSVMKKNAAIVVHYFGPDHELCDARGVVEAVVTNQDREEYLVLHSGDHVRLDRIITLNGIPGPAYGTYDSYAAACMDCAGGMDL